MVNMVSISGSVAPTRKKNVARILTLSILAMAFMFWGEFGFDFLLGSGGHDDESIGIISRRLLQNKKEPGRRNQNAIADQTHRNAKARRQDRQQRKRSLNDAKDVDFGTPPRENLGAPHRQGQSQHRQAQQAQRDTISEQRSLFANLLSFADPKSIALRVEEQQEERARFIAAVEETQHNLMVDADAAVAEGNTAFRVHPRNEDINALFVPSEILIEVINPKPDCQYSVTIVSHGKYTGSAMLITERAFVYSWKPVFPERYEVLVHEIDTTYGHETPLIQPPFPILINEGQQAQGLLAAPSGLSILENRIKNRPPCQTVHQIDLYSHWDGDWLGPDFQLEESIRTGWSFVPSSRMNCKLETFDTNAIRAIPDKKSIYILGRSVERGIFLSLVDMMLEKLEKKFWKTSWIGKCWGRASVSRGNLEVTYQDFRVNGFEDPTEPQFIECHNDKMVKQPGSSFIVNATKVWEEIFQQDESNWPSVIFLVAGLGSVNFQFKYHVQPFVAMLPPTWQGTLFIGDFEFSGRAAGLSGLPKYEWYLSEINSMVNQLNDPRVRWIDGGGISKEMRMYSQKGEKNIARSQHFHHPCFRRDETNTKEAMAVCSNITEMIGQLLLGHALGPKEEFMERVKQNPIKPDSNLRWCHACPKCMIPFHITPYPEMTCVEGPIVAKPVFDDCSGARFGGGGDKKEAKSKDSLTCPDSCLESPVKSEFGSETDTVYVRQCPV